MKNQETFLPVMKEVDELLAVSRGDMAAFERIFFAYHPKLVYFLKGMLHDVDASRDMVQDIFLSLWEKREHLVQVQDFSSYLFKINTSVKIYRSIEVEKLRFYFSGENLCEYSKLLKYYDPELDTQNDTMYPLMRNFSLGVNLVF
ncbi:hypothetical protein DWZ67_12795 [Bacteroides sp. AF34-31BH]|uniref:RNA polymerase sigma factor n=1 Tax=Bacteroides sp. AF34-31BH TaxID=2292931 RepID=UPI000E73A3F5|nr:sigma factor [Bacteroides sp. AF34-31BH]RJV04887.1 hypothetical protein DWZ67_12795 [Bacteroides sp. AF34-31BH]